MYGVQYDELEREYNANADMMRL
jgi:hypothetical protein